EGCLLIPGRVARREAPSPRFARRVGAVPFSRVEGGAAHAHTYGRDPVADAVAFFVDARQSLAGRRTGFTAVTRGRTRRGINGNVSEWLGAVEGLAAVHARLRAVLLENRPALDVIRQHDGPGTLFNCDPPYPHETRESTKEYGPHEMTEADHQALLNVLLACRGKVMLSGYPSRLYDEALAGWTRHT